MVTHYFIQQKFIEYDDIENAELVNRLYEHIGTYPWGTPANRWRKKMERFLNENTRTGKWRINNVKAKNQFLVYCRSIDNDIPVLLRFTFNFSEEAFAAHHYVVGVGYQITDDRKYDSCLRLDK